MERALGALKQGAKDFGLPRIIILAFFFILLLAAALVGMDIPWLISDVLLRWGMWGILVLAMVPSIRSGIGPNFGVAIGIAGGLLGALVSIELRYFGFLGTLDPDGITFGLVSISLAVLLALAFSSLLGILYGLLLNRVKGNEMIVSTYVGFSFVALFNILWLLLPFRSSTSIWPIAGQGLRTTINLVDDFGRVLNNLFRVEIGNFIIPTSLLLTVLLFCFVIWVFNKSRYGMVMTAAGSNPEYAKARGINVNRARIVGTTISTALAGVGIVMFSQGLGFLQLYNAPMWMGFSSVAAVLIGGATVKRAAIFNVLLGTLLFQGILTVALPVANELVPEGNLSEILRLIISNGIILYALSKARGGSK
ncbi:MAG: ABC transporter permease [Oscillospiraceae bacterium]|nr:ABC transporter permease [Oscillospiraceae bacterium]